MKEVLKIIIRELPSLPIAICVPPSLGPLADGADYLHFIVAPFTRSEERINFLQIQYKRVQPKVSGLANWRKQACFLLSHSSIYSGDCLEYMKISKAKCSTGPQATKIP
jgi:hypothetical protein